MFKEGIKSIKILNLRRIKTINYIKNCDSDVIISTRDIFDEWLGRYGMSSVVKIGWEHNHHHGNMDYAQKLLDHVVNLIIWFWYPNPYRNFIRII